tara:strand:+ start:1017 stop:1136 length:120 start_codon:yes stop_codon:yes gene_type:complete
MACFKNLNVSKGKKGNVIKEIIIKKVIRILFNLRNIMLM